MFVASERGVCEVGMCCVSGCFYKNVYVDVCVCVFWVFNVFGVFCVCVCVCVCVFVCACVSAWVCVCVCLSFVAFMRMCLLVRISVCV